MKCPYCGRPLKYTDTIDTEECDEQYIQTETHYCKKCNKTFVRKIVWQLVYEYDTWEEA